MKKKLEADLISLAHKILQLKNKEDVAVLQQEALKLYEKLSVLRFVEEHFEAGGPTIGKEAVEEKLETYEPAKKAAAEVSEGSFEENTSEEKPETEEVASPNDVASVIEQLAASKSVADDEPETSDIIDSEQETGETLDTETAEDEAEENQDADESEGADETEEKSEGNLGAENSEETEESEEEEEQKSAEIPSPTFEAAVELEQPEAQQEVESAASEPNEPLKDQQENEPVSTDPFAPAFKLDFDTPSEPENKYDQPAPSFTFDDLLGKDYADPVFVTQDELDKENSSRAASETKPDERWPESISAETPKETFGEKSGNEAESVETKSQNDDIWNRRPFESGEPKPEFDKPIASSSLNDKLSKGITIGLNDRIAFMKNLFNNSSEDYNRVLSQLMTIDNYAEARRFIQEIVKPDYNNWAGKEEFEDRFMEIVEKRFL